MVEQERDMMEVDVLFVICAPDVLQATLYVEYSILYCPFIISPSVVSSPGNVQYRFNSPLFRPVFASSVVMPEGGVVSPSA